MFHSIHPNHLPRAKILNNTAFMKKYKAIQIIFMSWVTEIKLKENEGTHSTSVNMRFLETLIIPLWVMKTWFPFRSLTKNFMVKVIEVNREIELSIWSVTPVSITQGMKLNFENTIWLWIADKKVPDRLKMRNKSLCHCLLY